MSLDFIAGENSVGSWLSGALLIISSTITAIIASKRRWYPWSLFSVFFMLLAIDENFMIHEGIKRSIVFTPYIETNRGTEWIGELPVIFAALVGMLVAWIMWKHVECNIRWLIVAGVAFGSASVVIDVLSLGILWEDGFKLIAELAVTGALAQSLRQLH